VRNLSVAWAVALGASVGVPLSGQAHSHEHASPYAEFVDRDIKALSNEEVEGLLTGAGLGMALPGELNGYPGPRHVLEIAPMLGLTAEQEARIREIFAAMQANAAILGEEVVELERQLDQAFAQKTIDEEGLVSLTSAIAVARARLRAIHLSAHLGVRPVLTDTQLEQYERIRGYGSDGS